MQPATPTTPSLNKKKHSQLWQLAMALMLAWGLLALSPHEANAAIDCDSVTEIPVAECEALVALYNSTNGPSWVRQDNWLVTTAPCSWYGIRCTFGTTPRHVSVIVLSLNNLSGNIPPEFGNLSSLEYLYLNNNQLSSLPLEIGNLTTLQELYIHSNPSLAGPLPDSLVQLTALYLFDFTETNLCEPGDVAFQSWLANIYNLRGTDVICSTPVARIVVTKTVGFAPDVCSDTSSFTVVANTTLYYCYTVYKWLHPHR